MYFFFVLNLLLNFTISLPYTDDETYYELCNHCSFKSNNNQATSYSFSHFNWRAASSPNTLRPEQTVHYIVHVLDSINQQPMWSPIISLLVLGELFIERELPERFSFCEYTHVKCTTLWTYVECFYEVFIFRRSVVA